MAEIISGDVLFITPDRSVKDAIQIMASKNVGAIIVDDGNQSLGIFTERDLL